MKLYQLLSVLDDSEIVRKEFQSLKSLFNQYSALSLQPSAFSILSMGMSDDFKMAIDEGSNMVRIGSLLFGGRSKK